MTTTTALSMDLAKERLTHLESYFPDSDYELLCLFGRFLVLRLNPKLVPMGFVNACAFAISDLKRGVDSYTGKPIEGRLIGYPQQMYHLLHLHIAVIAEAIFPRDFAEEVTTICKEIFARMSTPERTSP